jgi:hypothetical protein
MKPIVILAPAALVLLAACGADTDTADKPAAVDHSTMDHSGHDMGGEAKNELTEAQAAFKAVNDKMHAGMAEARSKCPKSP